jgi:hypothetical protein
VLLRCTHHQNTQQQSPPTTIGAIRITGELREAGLAVWLEEGAGETRPTMTADYDIQPGEHLYICNFAVSTTLSASVSLDR